MSRNLGFRVAWTWFFIRITFMFTVWLVSWRKPGNMTNGLLVSSTKRHLWVHPSGLTGKWFRCLTQKCMFTYIYIYVIYYIYCIYICYIILYIYIYYSILYYIYVYIYIYVFSDTPQVINTWNDKMICNQGLSFNPPCSVPSVIPAKCRLAFSIFQQCKSERTAAARISCVFSPGSQDSFQRYPSCHNFSLQRNYPIILPQDSAPLYTHIHIGYTYIHTHRIHIWYAYGVRKYIYIYIHIHSI